MPICLKVADFSPYAVAHYDTSVTLRFCRPLRVVTTCHGINFPLFCKAVFAAYYGPPQQGRSKIMSCLSAEAQRLGKYEFDIPFSRQQFYTSYLSQKVIIFKTVNFHIIA